MRILYLGLPLGALHLARAGHRPVVVATSHREAPGLRRLRRELGVRGALLLGRPDLADPSVRDVLARAEPDVLLSFFWPRRVPPEVLALPPRGAFGTHPSLLPRWRGPDPYFWTLRAGDAETGVSLHRLTVDYDTGPVVEQRRLPIEPADDAWRLARRLDRPALELLAGCADRLAAGETLEGTPQDEAAATLAPAPTEQELSIDWQRSAEEVVRLVRAAAPWPGAAARFGDRTVLVVAARVAPTPAPAALRPAEAWRRHGHLHVRTKNGAVVIDRVRDEAGRPLDPLGLL